MDIVEASNELQDWEVLNSSSDSVSATVNPVNPFGEIDSGGLIQVNYFSLEAQNRRFVEELDDDKSAESDNPSWADPELEEHPTRYLNKDSGEFWTDLSSERSEEHKFSGFEGRNEMGFADNVNKEVGFKAIEEIAEKVEEKEDLGEVYSDSSGTEMGSVKVNDVVENSQVGVEADVNMHEETEALGKEKCDEATEDSGNKKSGEIDKSVVWWKIPMELVKYYVFRMSPVWTISVAAAVMGFVILGRRLYTMKKKTRGLQIKVAFDDKTVSQVMSRAARLNEAFSVVKRVPMILPSMPALGANTWPAMRV